MILDSIPVFGLLRAKMSWLTDRQRVLAENVANADMPGYVAKDLQELDFHKLVSREAETARLARTHAGHMTTSSRATLASKVIESPDWETTPDGNSVVLEQEMMKVAQTQMEYQSAIGLYRKSIDMLKMALSSRS